MTVIDSQALKQPFPIAIVVSRFNLPITEALHVGAIGRLQELGFADSDVTTVWVPGAVEIPLTVKRLAEQKKYAAIVTLGAVIRGETTHYDYVCDQASQGCQQLALEYDVPVIFGVLTTENMAQAQARTGGGKGHKGRDAVDAACDMVSVLEQL